MNQKEMIKSVALLIVEKTFVSFKVNFIRPHVMSYSYITTGMNFDLFDPKI